MFVCMGDIKILTAIIVLWQFIHPWGFLFLIAQIASRSRTGVLAEEGIGSVHPHYPSLAKGRTCRVTGHIS